MLEVRKEIGMLIVVIFITILLFSGCTQKSKSDALSRLGYANREFGFGLNPPNNWTLDENQSNDNYAIFSLNQNDSNIPVSMSINASYVNSSVTLDSYFNSYIDENIKNGKFANYKLITRTDRTIQSSITTIAYENIYTYSGANDYVIKVKNLMIEPKEDVVICFEYITPISTYSTYEYEFEFSLSSLIFI